MREEISVNAQERALQVLCISELQEFLVKLFVLLLSVAEDSAT